MPKRFDPMTATDEEFAAFNRLPEKERDAILEANATACRLTHGCTLWNMHKGPCRAPAVKHPSPPARPAVDPNANLEEMRRLAVELLNLSVEDATENLSDVHADVVRLAQLVEALDGWIAGGGFLPKAWERKP